MNRYDMDYVGRSDTLSSQHGCAGWSLSPSCCRLTPVDSSMSTVMAAMIAVLTMGPLPVGLALRACHGLCAAVGLRFLTFVYSSWFFFHDVDCYHLGSGSEILTSLRSCAGRS